MSASYDLDKQKKTARIYRMEELLNVLESLQRPRFSLRVTDQKLFESSLHKHLETVQCQRHAATPGNKPLTASMLSAVKTKKEKRRMLREHFIPLIQSMHPDMAGNIAGSITKKLLDLDESEVLHMLESQESLKLKVAAIKVVLKENPFKTRGDQGGRSEPPT